MKKAHLLLIAVLSICIGCRKKAIIIGDFNGDNRVTFEQLRENPEPYMFKEISFEVGRKSNIGPGVDVTRDDDKGLSFDFKGQRSGSIEKIIEAYENGATSFLPDAGGWYIYYNSILPIQMEGAYPSFDHLENKYSIPDEHIKTERWEEFIYTSENTDSLIFSGILFESRRALKDSIRDRLLNIYGRRFDITRNQIYLTGVKIIPQ